MVEWGVPVASLIISTSTLIFAYIRLRSTATNTYVQTLEARLELSEKEAENCHKTLSQTVIDLNTAKQEISLLKNTNFKLMTELYDLQKQFHKEK